MALRLKPHSTEWFEALMQFNPEQAAHTASIIRLAGREDVCGVCGDEPAQDYELRAADLPPNAVVTMRLCEDCLNIRIMNGEPFVPLT